MDAITLNIPPGVVDHGTDSRAEGRWHDAHLARWTNGVLHPVGGWGEISNVFVPSNAVFSIGSNNELTLVSIGRVPRGSHAWYDNGGIPRLATGTHDKLYAWAGDPDTAIVDITPVSPNALTVGNLNSNENIGYGGKDYGEGTYGTPRATDGQTVPATSWIFDNFGEDLVALSTADRRIFLWDRTGTADVITPSSGTVPINNKGIIVTAERFLFALGANDDPRKIQWCDREDLTTWSPQPTNEAGDITLQTNGNIVCAEKVRGRTLILTTIDAHVATYQGPPTVYGFQRLASGCGIAGPQLSGAISGMAFWMGESQFFMYDGSTIRPIPCDVHDHVFRNINKAEIGSAFCVVNNQFNEIWWFYPSEESLENDRYVAYDYLENHWSIGYVSRATGVDSGVFKNPIWIHTLGMFHEHEKGFNHTTGQDAYINTNYAYAETGPARINQGNRVVKVNSVIPEEDTQGEVDIRFKTRFYPNDTETTHGPYSPANPTDVRFTGRQLRLRVDGDVGANWRFGPLRMRGREGGYR